MWRNLHFLKIITMRDNDIVTCWGYTPLIGRVLIRMIGFISSWVPDSPLITLIHRQYSAVAHLHHLHFTVAHALGFSVSASRLLATDLNIGIITVSHSKYYT
jgi:hypothetical protein